MPKKISDLPAATQVNAADLFEIVQAGVSKQASLNLPWVFGGQVTVGKLLLGDGTAANPALAFASAVATGLYIANPNDLRFSVGGADKFFVQATAVGIPDNTTGLFFGATADLWLQRDAANILAQRNGVNAQTFRLYNTFTDAANFERLQIRWTGNIAQIATSFSGTGSARPIEIGGDGAAEIRFFNNAAYRWTITAAGSFVAAIDNTLDIGASGANRPRTGYFGTSTVVGTAAAGRVFSDNLGIREFFAAEADPRVHISRDLLGSGFGGIGFGAGAPIDAMFGRDAANVLAQRNGASAQAFRVYNTFTDASNYERLSVEWSGNVAIIRTQQSGTGTARTLQIGTSGSADMQFISANVGRWRVKSDGHFYPEATNTYDIGSSGLTARTGYFGTSVVTPIVANTAAAPIQFLTNSGAGTFEQFRVAHVANAVNFLQADGGVVGDYATLSAQGSDTNVGLKLLTKGAGSLRLDPASGDILWGKALVALGGGATPTFGTIGGSGPTTAAQNTWMRVLDSTGAAFWVPTWK